MKSNTGSRSDVPDHHHFYFPPDAIDERDLVTFPESESSHMVSSLRLGMGDTVTATDGNGTVCRVRLEQVRGRQVKGAIVGVAKTGQPKPTIHVFQGIVKSSRMDLIVEKCTELGIASFTPVYTERSIRRLSAPRLERLRRIAVEAMKQSLGAYLPEVRTPVALDEAISALGAPGLAPGLTPHGPTVPGLAPHEPTSPGRDGFDLVLVAWEGELKRTLTDIAAQSPSSKIALWVGPEGGFTDTEISTFLKARALTFTLGNRRLKTETAAIASVAILHHILHRGPSGR